MRVRDVLVLGALTIGAMACGDSLAPEAREGKDLAFVLPAAEGELPSARSYRTWNEPVSESEIAKVRATQQPATLDGSGDGDAFLPVIFSRYAVGEFVDNFYRIQYGMFGFGSGYTMSPHVRILGDAGEVLLNQFGSGLSEDAPIYWYMRPHVAESFLLPTSCGAIAQLKVKFEVRVGLPFASLAQAGAIEDKTTYQMRCPVRPTDQGGGGGGPGPGEPVIGLTICYYELWIDGYGQIIDVYLLGCRAFTGTTQMT